MLEDDYLVWNITICIFYCIFNSDQDKDYGWIQNIRAWERTESYDNTRTT